jgi:hypothetical protein
MSMDNDMDNVAAILRRGYCTGGRCGGKGIGQEDHTCPFSEEINEDTTTLCNCCNICTYECAMDI